MATRVTAPVTTSTPATKRRHRADGTCPSGKSTGSNVTWSQYGGCRRYHRTLIRHPVRGWLGPQPAVSYDCVMTQPYDVEGLPSPSSALLQLARLKAGMSQRELAERAGVPVTMISAYERDQRQPTLTTLLRLLHAAGFDLRLHLAAYDPHDDILAGLEAGRSEAERLRRDRQLQAWRQATPAEDVA